MHQGIIAACDTYTQMPACDRTGTLQNTERDLSQAVAHPTVFSEAVRGMPTSLDPEALEWQEYKATRKQSAADSRDTLTALRKESCTAGRHAWEKSF